MADATVHLTLPWPPSVNRYWRSVPMGRGRGVRVLISREGRAFRWDAVARIARAKAFALTLSITVEKKAGDKFDQVVRHELGEKPARLDDPDARPGLRVGARQHNRHPRRRGDILSADLLMKSVREMIDQYGDNVPDTRGTVAYYNELSYRRGVHQALSLAGDIVRDVGHDKAADLLDRLCDMAGDMRYDGKPHSDLLTELEKAFKEG